MSLRVYSEPAIRQGGIHGEDVPVPAPAEPYRSWNPFDVFISGHTHSARVASAEYSTGTVQCYYKDLDAEDVRTLCDTGFYGATRTRRRAVSSWVGSARKPTAALTSQGHALHVEISIIARGNDHSTTILYLTLKTIFPSQIFIRQRLSYTAKVNLLSISKDSLHAVSKKSVDHASLALTSSESVARTTNFKMHGLSSSDAEGRWYKLSIVIAKMLLEIDGDLLGDKSFHWD
ncbi:hypothetical protein BKA62DRAFT_760326 [Auriculariales sp. MPI-PUGE-AT-0066]|nr:hypothetical protein BKA62DRAFT_760326 [Auriculariales sp. MPI-PUGE-AT-0066]